jgi:hypothetical protein
VNSFVDATDPAQVEAVLAAAVTALGPAGALASLAGIPELEVVPARPGGLFRAPTPATVEYGDQRLSVDARGRATLHHVVGGIVLSQDAVSRSALAGALAGLAVRAVADSGANEEVSVLLTALRDAVAAAG